MTVCMYRDKCECLVDQLCLTGLVLIALTIYKAYFCHKDSQIACLFQVICLKFSIYACYMKLC